MIKAFKSESGKEQVLKSYNQLLDAWGTECQELDVETPYGITHWYNSGSSRSGSIGNWWLF
ncbi:hypothetical protein [Paenibacillus sp. FSL H8-0332]|uniref:hypothetical protein n=1 Tax=Paenibacillus sp. FSL H8-0332 TaxID=2954742 RepID=UPI0030D0C9F7